MNVSDFDYELPERLIAQRPRSPRDASRLMVLRRGERAVEHRTFRDLPALLAPGDLLVLNDTRVLPARLVGRRATGGRAEVLLLHPVEGHGEAPFASGAEWQALARPARRLRVGEAILFDDGASAGGSAPPTGPGLQVTIVAKGHAGEVVVRLENPGGASWRSALDRWGEVPLPPYIHSVLTDPERYQTIYAEREGSAAAPTAGLHFTPAVFGELAARGIVTTRITLHVGLGTFRPVTSERVEDHPMHAEWCEVSVEAERAIREARGRGSRVVAVGTTACRTLEGRAGEDGVPMAGAGWTDIYIYPGYRFRATDALLTNFHLPRSTLLMLVAAFAGREFVLEAYREAVRGEYRFFSFGDAMLVL